MIYAKRPRRRARPHVFRFMGGKLVCDNYAGYKALFDHGVIEAGCLAHARHKLHDLYANHRSAIAEEGLRYFAALIEREAREQRLDADGRRQLRQQRSKPIAEALRQWLTRQCGQVPGRLGDGKGITRRSRWPGIGAHFERNMHLRLSKRPGELWDPLCCHLHARPRAMTNISWQHST